MKGAKIIKKSFVYRPEGKYGWDNNSMLTPQPFLKDEETIRVFASIRDEEGRGRIGFVDVSAQNPSEILKVSEKPVIDLGEPGMFDDNGVLLGDLIRVGDEVYMYYVGFEIPMKAKHTCYTGLAISKDNGDTFERFSPAPVMDRSEEGLFGRAIHTIIQENGIFRTWYAVVFGWKYINGKPFPKYNIRYSESTDGKHFPNEGKLIIDCADGEYRIGRPKVRRISGGYEMRFTYDTDDKRYISGYAESVDGINWVRNDKKSFLEQGTSGWDIESVYPAIVETKYGKYMFYNGERAGATGFGYAEVIDG